jgi:ribose 5-phosphate isomerase A
MTQDDKKRAVARAALELVEPGKPIGVGSGSTADHFIGALGELSSGPVAAVASSVETARRLEAIGLRVVELGDAGRLSLYVDGADEAMRSRELIKGGGGALTREKIVAEASEIFVCIIDDSKLVERLGAFPLPVEVIPMACATVARELERRGGRPVVRDGYLTDNGNPILDVHGLEIDSPVELERELNQIPGLVACGLFAKRPADLLLVGGPDGVERI